MTSSLGAPALFWSLLSVQWAIFAWDYYLIQRQFWLHKKTTKRPDSLADLLTEEQFNKARVYSTDKLFHRLVKNSFDMILTTVILVGGALPWLWTASESFSPSYPVPVFLAATSFFSYIIDLPWSLYEHFILEELHGFNKYTVKFYLVDSVKKTIMSYAIMTPLLMIALWMIDNLGEYFFVYLWVFASLVILAALTIYPTFIAPLFDTYIPLPDGPLKTAIEKLAASVDYPLKKLYVVDGSRRSGHSNAYMYGFWKNKRIVLYDTLLNGEERIRVKHALAEASKHEMTEEEKAEEERKLREDGKGMSGEEVVAVLGHELGHWAESHTIWQLAISEANILLLFFAFSVFHGWPLLGEAFGFRQQPTPTLISLVLIMQYVLSIISEVMSVAIAVLTRRMEFAADAYAARLGYTAQLKAALTKLSADNLSLPLDDHLYSLCKHSHPPVPERIAALKKFE